MAGKGGNAASGTSGTAGTGTTAGSGGSAGSVTAGSSGTNSTAGSNAGGTGGTVAGMGGGGTGFGGKGFGGMPNTGGSAGNPGGTGGSASGSGGQGTGGVPSKGDGPLGPELTDVDAITPATCTITPTVMPAQAIPMVGIATFTTDLAGASGAIIQFGESAEYTLEAPVDWAEPEHRTLILGMPANTAVHYRVVVFAGDTACVGPDATFQTGAPPSGAPANVNPTRGTSAVAPAPGFIIAENGNNAFIVNKAGKVVWAHRFPVSLTRALMSWDGKYMIARELGPFNAASGGAIYRVAMDGTGEMKLNVSGGTHHDVTVTPTGIAYPAKAQAGQCDSLYVANLDGSNSRAVVNLDVVFGKFDNGPGSAAMEECHVNAIHYYADRDAFSLSDREKDAIAFVSSSGEVIGSIGATPNGQTPNHAKAEGADSTTNSAWRVQHGHDWYEDNKLIVWSNGSFMGGMSKLLHYTINGSMATLDWEYGGTGNSPTLSDAQHLPNGNFLGTCSQTGAVHEIDPE
ncbi:MAG TPA: aryl-sulfate sulfotransferase, partial [Polyangiaceae bacterium]